MASTTYAQNGIRIGAKDLVFAKMLTDSSSGTTYETDMHSVPGLQEIGLTANVSEDQVPADDNPAFALESSLDSIEVTLTMASIPAAIRRILLGETLDGANVVLTKSNDSPPWVAMGFKSVRSDGSTDYVWLTKGKFKQGDMTYRTKEKGQINWQNAVLTGTFVPRMSDNLLKYNANDAASGTGVEAVTSTAQSAFFTTVYTTTAAAPQSP